TPLLIELLGGLGAHEADAALRLRAMRRAGWDGRALAIGPEWEEASARRAVADSIASRRASEIWLAGPRARSLALAHGLPEGTPFVWWPTIVPGTGGEPEGVGDAAGGAGVAGGSGAPTFEPGPRWSALGLAPLRSGRDRAPVPLWDGEFVLVPG